MLRVMEKIEVLNRYRDIYQDTEDLFQGTVTNTIFRKKPFSKGGCLWEPPFLPESGMLRVMETTEMLNRYRDIYRDAEDLIQGTVTNTISWLFANKESFDSTGGSRFSQPWWPDPEETSNELLLEERGRTLRARLWEHGLLKMLYLLLFDEFKPKQVEELRCMQGENMWDLAVKIATDPWTAVVIGELVKGDEAGPPHDQVSLSYVKELFRYSPNTISKKVRKRVLDLASLGLVDAEYDEDVSPKYIIRIGPVARKFYREVYFPIIRDSNRYINPAKEKG